MKRWTPWLLAAACLMAGGAMWWYRAGGVVAAPQDPAALVRRAYTDGRRVALSGRQSVSMAGERGRPIVVEAEVLCDSRGDNRIRYLTRPLKDVTVWENGDRTFRYNPARKHLSVAHRRQDGDGIQQGSQLLQNYVPHITGREKVAGRSALTVVLQPRSGGDRFKRISIDPETWVILASEERSEKSGILYSTRFTEVRYFEPGTEPRPEELQPPAALIQHAEASPGDSSSRFEPAQLSELIGFGIREPRWLPKGYRLAGAYQTPCYCQRRHQAARLEYFDGLSWITLFECGHTECTATDNCFGDDGKSSLALQYARDGVRYLIVGDASRDDLFHIVRSASR